MTADTCGGCGTLRTLTHDRRHCGGNPSCPWWKCANCGSANDAHGHHLTDPYQEKKKGKQP